jgi:hypothetical protein
MREPIGTKAVYDGNDRPSDQQRVLYYFEPFEQWYVGVYHTEDDSVTGKNGFSTWQPEVTKWMDGTE